jgi:hypothetical protein
MIFKRITPAGFIRRLACLGHNVIQAGKLGGVLFDCKCVLMFRCRYLLPIVSSSDFSSDTMRNISDFLIGSWILTTYCLAASPAPAVTGNGGYHDLGRPLGGWQTGDY